MSYNNKITAMDRIGNKMDIGQNMFTYIADEIGILKYLFNSLNIKLGSTRNTFQSRFFLSHASCPSIPPPPTLQPLSRCASLTTLALL